MQAKELFTIPEETSWHFERILKPDDKTVGNYVLIQPGAADIAKVTSAYFHHPVEGYNIASIEIIYNETLNRLFYSLMSKMNGWKGNSKRIPKWKTNCHGQEKVWRDATHSKLQELAKNHADSNIPNITILPLWHGTSDDVSQYIFNEGYGIFTENNPNIVTDEGYFGKGVYTAHEAEYSFRAYAQKHGDKAVLLLNWVSSFEAYPVIDGDMSNLKGKMGGYDQCDAHFIPVRSDRHPNTTIYLPCKPNELHQYTEMVVFSEDQCLPRYRVKLIKSVPQAGIDNNTLLAYQAGLDLLNIYRYKQAVNAFEEALDAGHPAASIRLYWLHSGASGVIPANTQELAKYQHPPQSTIEYLKRKANFRGENDAESEFNLAWCHQQGLGIPVNQAKAVQYYWLAARQGHREAQYQLGVCCATSTGVKKDMDKAIFYYEQAAAKGHAHANYLLFQCYELGLGVSPNEAKAAHYKQAAQKGSHPKLAELPMEQLLAQKESQIKQQESQLTQKESQVQVLTQAVLTGQQELQAKDAIIRSKENESLLQQQKIAQLLSKLEIVDTELTQKEEELKASNSAIGEIKFKNKELKTQLEEAQKQPKPSPQKSSTRGIGIFDHPLPKPDINSPKPFQVPQNEQTQKDLLMLFKWVSEGHLLEAEKLLQKNPNLALVKGTVKDLSGRTFTNTSAFQYAAWALDIEMCELMLKYFDQSGAVAADIQLKELETKPGPHGTHYDIDPLLKKTQEYISNWDNWDQTKREQHWQKEVGGEQRKCPAWLIYAWCERGENVAWAKKDLKNIKVVRQYNEGHIKWWYENEYNGGKGVGSKWSGARGGSVLCSTIRRAGRGDNTIVRVGHDNAVGQSVKPNCYKALTNLKAKLEKSKKSVTGGQVIFDIVLRPNIISPQQQAKQDQLIEALLKGDFELVKKLEFQGASFLYMNKEGIYPLAAAVYGCNLELVRYIEGKLKDDATEQWEKVDAEEFANKLRAQIPSLLHPNATYRDLGNWYITHAEKQWNIMYDTQCLKAEIGHKWDEHNWINRGNILQRNSWKTLLSLVMSEQFMDGVESGLGGGLYAPSREIHDGVVKTIREQLNEFKKEVDFKAKRPLNAAKPS